MDGFFDGIPYATQSPLSISRGQRTYVIWDDRSEFLYGGKRIEGHGKVYLDLLPRPSFQFEFTPRDATVDHCAVTQELLKATAQLVIGAPTHNLRVSCTSLRAKCWSGVVAADSINYNSSICSAKYLIVNGPEFFGSSIQHNGSAYIGRVEAVVSGVSVIVDQLRDRDEHKEPFEFTHVAELTAYQIGAPQRLAAVKKSLFRTLSMMNGRWVGIIGPWTYDSAGNLVNIHPMVTLASINSRHQAWCDATIRDAFVQLFPAIHERFLDPILDRPLRNALHWWIETEQCAGGLESSIILQQAALECLAWLEIVQVRQLCSDNGFKNLPAADKIRWLLSLHSIECKIPTMCTSIMAYAKALTLRDLPDVLVDVRNALVHSEPKKVDRLRQNVSADSMGGLWYQVGGILNQVLLALIGYNGMMLRRDVDAEFAVEAIRLVPWAS